MLILVDDDCRFTFSMPIHQHYHIPNSWPWYS